MDTGSFYQTPAFHPLYIRCPDGNLQDFDFAFNINFMGHFS